jgi:hypothetical protein
MDMMSWHPGEQWLYNRPLSTTPLLYSTTPLTDEQTIESHHHNELYSNRY